MPQKMTVCMEKGDSQRGRGEFRELAVVRGKKRGGEGKDEETIYHFMGKRY